MNTTVPKTRRKSRSQREWEARARYERHGEGELLIFSDVPLSATGCVLSDGGYTKAQCLTRNREVSDDERVWERCIDDTRGLHRRGYLHIEHGVALKFFDAPYADQLPYYDSAPDRLDILGDDLIRSDRMHYLVRGNKLFGELLCAALKLVSWVRVTDDVIGTMDWNRVYCIMAVLRGEGSPGNWHGDVGWGLDEVVLAEMWTLGWQPTFGHPIIMDGVKHRSFFP